MHHRQLRRIPDESQSYSSILKTVLRIFSLLLPVLVINAALYAADLPVIEMPKYVITGIEQATTLSGKKIPTESSSHFLLPDFNREVRPVIPLDILDTPSEKPILFRLVGGGYTEVGASSGGFGKATGRLASVYEGSLTGYSVNLGMDRYPMRTSSGPKLDGFVNASGLRWIGQEATFTPEIKSSFGSFVRNGSLGNETNNQFALGLQAGTTPFGLFAGRLTGKFLFDLTILDNHRNILASHDLLTLGFSREIWQGWLESRLDFEVEAVSVDKGSHSLYSIESIYCRRLGEKLLWRAGLIAYTGKVIPTPVLVAPGTPESRSGAGLIAGITWKAASGSAIDFDYLPKPHFETFGSTFSQMMALDSTARGVTVEVPFNLRLRVSHILNKTARLRFSYALSDERHRSFWMMNSTGNWRTSSRKAHIAISRLDLELEPHQNVLVTLFGVLTKASSSGSGVGANAPFISPAEVGSDVVIYLGKVAINNNLVWKRGSLIFYNGASRSSDLMDWNASAHWSVRPGLTGRVGIDNLLDRDQWKIPSYQLPPLTVWAGIEWRGNDPLW